MHTPHRAGERSAAGRRTRRLRFAQGQDQRLSGAPGGEGKRPAVVVIQENRGLNPHLEDIARRLADEGFLAFAPDLLSVSGGTPPDEEKARELHAKTDPEDITAA